MQNQITNSLQGKIKGSSIPVDSAIFHTLSQIILLIEEGVHKENNSEISQRVSDLIELISGSVIESLRKDQVIRGLSTLVNAIRKNTVMIHVSPEGYILDANEKMAELSGYTLAELQGAHTRIFNSRVHTEDFWKDFYSSIQSGEIWVGDICNKGKNGELFWLHTIVQPIYDTTGNIFQYIVIRQNITEEKALKEREEAYRERRLDPITGLPGKTALLEDLKNREHQLFLLVHADGMSKFHTDSQHGSIGGDEILRQISIRLPQIVSSSGGMVYKLDGVDFGIVFPDTLERKQAQYVIDGIEKMEFYLADEKIPLTFSTSVTQHISDANETIIRAYDGVQRLRQEKKTDEYRINLETQKIVEKAFERNLVFPEFQEIFRNSLSSFPRKFEVLARMIHPDTHETLYPGYFLGSVESLGLQGKLTREMIRRGAVAIHGTFHELSFNITQQDLIDDTFVDFVQGICSHFSLAPGQFIFEILEKIRNITHPQAVQTLKQLREFGCKIAVDDFGTGESGIHRLTGKGFHYLKVAGEYVKGIDGDNDEGEAKRTFLEIAIYGARKNHMEVIAEGVETKDEWNVLRGLGVDYFQGYYFSRPIPFISDDILGNEQK